MKKTLPPTWLYLALGLCLVLHGLAPLRQLWVFPWTLLGLLPLGAGAAVNLLADRELKRAGTTVKPFGKPDALVTGGAYGWSRNPMYVGMTLMLAGVAGLPGSASPWLAVLLFAVLVARRFAVLEEKRMEAAHGAAFREYCRRVRRWI